MKAKNHESKLIINGIGINLASGDVGTNLTFDSGDIASIKCNSTSTIGARESAGNTA